MDTDFTIQILKAYKYIFQKSEELIQDLKNAIIKEQIGGEEEEVAALKSSIVIRKLKTLLNITELDLTTIEYKIILTDKTIKRQLEEINRKTLGKESFPIEEVMGFGLFDEIVPLELIKERMQSFANKYNTARAMLLQNPKTLFKIL